MRKPVGFKRILFFFLFLLVVYFVMTSVLYIYSSYESKYESDQENVAKQRRLVEETIKKAQLQREIAQRELEEKQREEEARINQRKLKEIDDYVSRSNEFKAAGRWVEAMKELENGLAKYPTSDKLLTYKGGWYFDKGNFSEAKNWYLKAFEMNPKESIYPANVALCYNKLNKPKEAVEFMKKVYAIDPSLQNVISLVDSQMKLNDFENWYEYNEAAVKGLQEAIRKKQKLPVNPYLALHINGLEVEEIFKIAQYQSTQTYNRAMQSKPEPFTHEIHNSRIRVGYVSYDFRTHAVGIQIKSIFGFHDRTKFETFCFNVNDESNGDSVYQKIESTCEHMVQIGKMDVKEAAKLVHSHKIDILIDLGLFTAYARMDIFALRPAPIQACYLGLATTTGASWFDYIIADKYVITPEFYPYYSEKVVHLPHSYHVFDHKQSYKIPSKPPRSKYGWPQNNTIYCNPQNHMRFDPPIFDVWSRIIKRVENSTLIIKHHDASSAANLLKAAKERGLVTQDQVKNSTNKALQPQFMFLHSLGSFEHLEQKTMCDVYLDVHKYNGHSTSGDMLWAGVPMVTYPGTTMASRAAGSFSISSGLPEMIANDWQSYEDLAVRYGQDKEFYNSVRTRLENGRMTSPVFDMRRWVKNLERGLEEMWNRYKSNLPPDHIVVEDVGVV